MLHRLATAVLFVALMSAAAPATAQEVADLNNKAVQLTKAGEYMEAIEIWLGLVDNVDPEYEYLWAFHLNIGRAFHKLLDPAPAWWHLTRSLELNPDHKKTGEWLDEVETALGKGHVKVTVKANAAGTRVRFIHGKREEWYPVPFTWWFKPGSYKLTAQAEGYHPADVDVRVGAESTEVEVVLKKVLKKGKLVVTVEPREADTFLDGKRIGRGGIHGFFAEGDHIFEAKLEGYGNFSWTLYLKAGGVVEKHVILNPGRRPVAPPDPVEDEGAPAWKWVLAGSSVAAALAGGVTFYIAATNAGDERDAISTKYNLDQGVSPSLESTVRDEWDKRISDNVSPWVTTSYVLWGFASVTAITSAILLYPDLTSDSPEGTASWQFSPTHVPGGAGFCGGLRF